MIEFLSKKTNIDFMGKRKIALVFSAILSIIGLITIFQIAAGSANLGIDFAGGTAVQIKFKELVPLQDIRKALNNGGLSDFDLQDLPSVNKVLIRVKKSDEDLGNISKQIISILSKEFSESNIVIDSTIDIGPKVGAKLRQDALWAVMAAIIGILIYITFRFQFRYGIGATVATFHDVLAVLGIMGLMGKEINLVLLSALLMIAGYSLTDTVVVFDRVRENIRSKRGMPIYNVINQSINEVLSRTIITAMTTFFSAVALFIFGGEVIHDFALAVMLGIIVGTFSSIFIASPIVYLMGEKAFHHKK